MDRLGRKKSIQIGAFVATIGAVLQCAAYNLATILVGRIIAGWAVGLMSISVPVYQAECAPPRIRGLIVGLTQQMIGVGFIVSTWIGYGCSHAPRSSSLQWRFPLAFQALPAAVLFIGIVWMPESPRYLIERGRVEQGLYVLQKLHGESRTNEDLIQAEFDAIQETIRAEGIMSTRSWITMFTDPMLSRRLMHGTLVQVFTQFTGASKLSVTLTYIHFRLLTLIGKDVINYYQTIMYDALGFTGKKGILVAGFYNLVGPITSEKLYG
jgi:MFS family permease